VLVVIFLYYLHNFFFKKNVFLQYECTISDFGLFAWSHSFSAFVLRKEFVWINSCEAMNIIFYIPSGSVGSWP
jgi:hypothetical protein